jgi:hypothetical protein
VKVTDVVSNAAAHGAKEDAKQKAAEHGTGDSTEHEHMTVTGIKMVSESCSNSAVPRPAAPIAPHPAIMQPGRRFGKPPLSW